jgi:hypothetical protein
MVEKYKNNKSHFVTRGCTILGIIFLFVLHTIFIDPYSLFFALPLLIVLVVVDLIVLTLLKAFAWQKLLINFAISTVIIPLLFLIVS